LEWGQVLVHVRATPVNPADLSASRGAEAGSNAAAGAAGGGAAAFGISTLGVHGDADLRASRSKPPAGGDFVGVVLKVGAGVKTLTEGDWVIPRHPSVGAWRSVFAVKEKELRKIPTDLLPLEHACLLREYSVAYRLLEDAGETLRPGDAVIVNGASGAIGGVLIQLCGLLKMRAVAVIRPTDPRRDTNANAEAYFSVSPERSDREKAAAAAAAAASEATGGGFSRAPENFVTAQFARTAERLKALGAAEVLADEGDLRAALERRRFFARPKVAYDCVGGASAARVTHALQDNGRLVAFGCMSGRPVTLPWTTLVARGLVARGFSLRKWMDKSSEPKIQKMFETVAKLVNADKLRIPHCEYELSQEFAEAMEHANETRREVKIVLRVDEVGDTYE
jgi:trans-2-enoyl-CoA reductase